MGYFELHSEFSYLDKKEIAVNYDLSVFTNSLHYHRFLKKIDSPPAFLMF